MAGWEASHLVCCIDISLGCNQLDHNLQMPVLGSNDEGCGAILQCAAQRVCERAKRGGCQRRRERENERERERGEEEGGSGRNGEAGEGVETTEAFVDGKTT